MKKYATLFFLFSIIIEINAQQSKIDSLRNLLRNDKHDTDIVNHLNNLARAFFNSGAVDSALRYGNLAVIKAEKINFKKGLGNAWNNVGLAFSAQGEFMKTLDCYTKSLRLREEIGDKKGVSGSRINIGIIYTQQGFYDKALESFLKGLEIAEEINFKPWQSNALGGIGTVYQSQGDFPKALIYALRALKIDEQLEDKRSIAARLGNIAIIFQNQADFMKAIEYYEKALNIFKEIGLKASIATQYGNIGAMYLEMAEIKTDQKEELHKKALEALFKAEEMDKKIGNKHTLAIWQGNIGSIYQNQGDYSKALKYCFNALKIDEEINNQENLAIILGNIGNIYTIQNKFKDALPYLYRSLVINDSIGAKKYVKISYEQLSALYQKSNISLPDSLGGKLLSSEEMRLRAMYYYKRSIEIKDSLFNIDKANEITRKEMNYEYEIKDAAAKAEQDKKEAIAKTVQEAKDSKNKVIIYSVSSGLFLVLLLAIFIFWSYRLKRIANKELTEKNNLIEKSKHIIEEKNKDITDSINYAKRLQDAILPPEKFWKDHLPNSFVLYKPKDIVAGDFFYMESVDGNILFAAADCTGHGIPGCIVSVVCSNALNRSIREFRLTDPGKILSKVCELEEETFARSENTVRDGMDIALCKYNHQTKQLDYAGAHRPLWVIRNGKIEIEEIKGTKAAVGVSEGIQLFEQHSIQLSSGDTVYIFSDGYVDQFSPKDKKFMSKRLKDLLLSIQSMSMQEQHNHLNSFIDDWRGGMEQTDDILLIGVKI